MNPFINNFLPILVFFSFSFLLSLIIFGFSIFLAFQRPGTDKLSVYECGFDAYNDARSTFDIKFYLIAILFVIFDLETMFVFTWSVSLSGISSNGFWIMVDFMFELLLGYIYVWKSGAFDW